MLVSLKKSPLLFTKVGVTTLVVFYNFHGEANANEKL